MFPTFPLPSPAARQGALWTSVEGAAPFSRTDRSKVDILGCHLGCHVIRLGLVGVKEQAPPPTVNMLCYVMLLKHESWLCIRG